MYNFLRGVKMTILEVLILSVAMAIDALIVSFSFGLIMDRKRFFNSLLLATSFGFFQFIMPILGWGLSTVVYDFLYKYSKFVVFIVFMMLGLKFLKDCFEKDEQNKITCLSVGCIIGLSFATSIDALAAGVSIKFKDMGILMPALSIGIVTFLLSFLSFWSTKVFKKLPKRFVGGLGALLLIYLAIKAII